MQTALIADLGNGIKPLQSIIEDAGAKIAGKKERQNQRGAKYGPR